MADFLTLFGKSDVTERSDVTTELVETLINKLAKFEIHLVI